MSLIKDFKVQNEESNDYFIMALLLEYLLLTLFGGTISRTVVVKLVLNFSETQYQLLWDNQHDWSLDNCDEKRAHYTTKRKTKFSTNEHVLQSGTLYKPNNIVLYSTSIEWTCDFLISVQCFSLHFSNHFLIITICRDVLQHVGPSAALLGYSV